MNHKKLAFVVDDLSSGQIPYLLVTNANRFLAQSQGYNISIFFEDNYLPCVPPAFARFNVKDARMFNGHLISTDIKTTNLIRACTQAKRYFYINELESDRKEWEDTLKDDGIVKFTRSKDYLDELTKQGFNIHPKVVPDFSMLDILEIINER